MAYRMVVDNQLGKGIHVFVDDIKIDSLKKAGQTEYTLPAGPHIVYCRIIGMTSEILRVEAVDGESVALACVPRQREKFLTGDAEKTKVLAPLKYDNSWLLIPALLTLNLVLILVKYASMTPEEIEKLPPLLALAVVVGSITAIVVVVLVFTGQLARNPINTTALR